MKKILTSVLMAVMLLSNFQMINADDVETDEDEYVEVVDENETSDNEIEEGINQEENDFSTNEDVQEIDLNDFNFQEESNDLEVDIDSEDPFLVETFRTTNAGTTSLFRAARKVSISTNNTTIAFNNVTLKHAVKYQKYSTSLFLDISEHQGNKIDWAKVKADGVDYVILRVGYRGWGTGKINEDKYFVKNIKEAQEAGIQVGIYFFSEAINEKEAREEADFVLKHIKDYEIHLPIFMDLEWIGNGKDRLWTANLSKDQMTKNALAFCDTISEAGYSAGIYANKTFLNESIHATTIASKYNIWLAHWTTSTDYTGNYSFWQYGSATIDGIKGEVDANVMYEKIADTLYFLPKNTCTRAQMVTFLWRNVGSPSPTTSENPFVDVDEESTFYNAILWAYENDITTGTTPTTFEPDALCTRAQVVAFLYRYDGEKEPIITNVFNDVDEESTFYNAILWAYENGITTGTSATKFSPDSSCRRDQIVTFIWRFENEPEFVLDVNPFKDIDESSTFYKAVIWAFENNITTGVKYKS